MQIEIEPVWRFRKEGSPQTAVVMLGVLNQIRETGKLTSAAEHAHLSYRHVWNLVEQWSEFFGVPLVETHRGKGTTLTPFGEKLVWAGQRMQARLGPQLENLAQELATEIKPFLHQRPSVIRVHASHGFAVSRLRELLDKEPGIGVDLRYVSNQNSLLSLAQGACDLSGVHVPRGELAAHHHAEQIDLHYLAEVVKLEIEKAQRGRRHDAGVVEHDVEPAELGDGGVDQRLNLGLIGDIGLLKHGIAAELGGQRLAALGIHIGDHHLGALGDEQLDGGAPDAARPARDDRDLAAQFLGHFTLQCLTLSSPNPE